MATLDNAKAVAEAYFDELKATAEIRQAYNEIIVMNAGVLFGAFGHDGNLKRRLTEALKLKTTDQSAMLRGLFVQAIGVFDEFVRALIATELEKRAKEKKKYSELSQALQNGFISHAGRVLTHYGSGSVNGVKYDFSRLNSSLASCLTDEEGFSLEPRVFTVLMGNSTPERLRKIFETIGLPDPFGVNIGESTELKRALGETRKSVVARMADERLAKLISIRNDIAHGELTTSISYDEFIEGVDFLCALIGALKELCE